MGLTRGSVRYGYDAAQGDECSVRVVLKLTLVWDSGLMISDCSRRSGTDHCHLIIPLYVYQTDFWGIGGRERVAGDVR